MTDLRSKAAKCEFGTFESDMIRDKVVFAVRDERIKERLLREADLTLNKALDICRDAEISEQQIEAMGVTQTQALSIIRGNVSFFLADLAVQILYVHYNICCFILLFYLCTYVNAEMARLRVLSLWPFIGHSISVAASRVRPKAIRRADM